MEHIEGLQDHKSLQQLLEKVERRMKEGDSDDAALNMRKVLEYITGQYVREFAQEWTKNNLFETIKGLQTSGVIDEETAGLFHRIRIMGNKGGAHFAQTTISMADVKDSYRQLLDYVPTFLRELPVPSTKEVSNNPYNIDYTKITPLLITQKNYGVNLELDQYFPKTRPEYWDPFEDNIYGDIERLQWTQQPQRYIYEEDGYTYINRFQLVVDILDELEYFTRTGERRSCVCVEDSVYIPGIVQEYFGFAELCVREAQDEIKSPNGMTAVRRGSAKKVFWTEALEPLQILIELSAFNRILEVPECAANMALNRYQGDHYGHITEIHIPGVVSAEIYLAWKKGFPQAKIVCKDGGDFLLEGGSIDSKDKKELLYAPEAVPLAEPAAKPTPLKPAIPKPQAVTSQPRVSNKSYTFKEIKQSDISSEVSKYGPDAWYPNLNEIYSQKAIMAAITELIIPEGVTCLILPGFSCYKNLRRIQLPSTLRILGEGVCSHYGKLEEIYIPDGVRQIRSRAFFACKQLKKVRIPDTIELCSPDAFSECPAIREVEAPERLWGLFKDCPDVKLTSVAPHRTAESQIPVQPAQELPPVPAQSDQGRKQSLFQKLKGAFASGSKDRK